MSQKAVFLDGEGDAWLARNQAQLGARILPEGDPVLAELLELPLVAGARVLEVGCGDGARLRWLQAERGLRCHGLDPSAEAVRHCVGQGIEAVQGTADRLPFGDREMDVLIFGFCLYLCDREDLFRIAAEADRVLKAPGWLILHDFHATLPTRRAYHHVPGLFSYKMDYRTLFSWHPGYVGLTHKVRHHVDHRYTDEPGEWVATAVMRKRGEGA